MTFDELEVGKEYNRPCGDIVRVVDKAPGEVAFRILDVGLSEPFGFHPSSVNFSDWRPYTPPPEPVVRYAYARQYGALTGSYQGDDEGDALRDPKRVGPVIKVELPVRPDMLARVRDGAK